MQSINSSPSQDVHTDVFSISGRGTVATGRVERGIANKGDEVEIVGLGAKLKTTLTGIGERLTLGFARLCLTLYVYRNVPQGIRPRS